MIYTALGNTTPSALGLGCMRLPMKDGEIDVAAVREMVDYALSHGVNYFDTAWGYHGGASETVMGEVLSAYPRESYYLTSKFPGYDVSNLGKVREIFPKQLEKCRTEYFDFYLFHNVCELNIDGYLDEKNGIFKYLSEQKRAGRIRHLGFSAHGSIETLLRFLDAYGDAMEFGMLQINWLDWEFQNARAKVKLLAERGIPVFVMEPLRGGSLVSLADKYAHRLSALAPERTLAEWALRFVQGIPEVRVTLSGMSNMEQLKENIATYAERRPLSDIETQALLAVGRDMTSVGTHPCTSCRYCTEYCPQSLNIPWLIELYNEQVYSGGGFRVPMALRAVSDDKKPAACLSCRACESVCPQNIKISEVMADFAQKVEGKA